VGRQDLLFLELLDVQAAGAAVDVPVDLARVVARRVVAVVGELDRGALADAAAVALAVARHAAAADEREPLQPLEERAFEELNLGGHRFTLPASRARRPR
jgi:hypothetical protein